MATVDGTNAGPVENVQKFERQLEESEAELRNPRINLDAVPSTIKAAQMALYGLSASIDAVSREEAMRKAADIINAMATIRNAALDLIDARAESMRQTASMDHFVNRWSPVTERGRDAVAESVIEDLRNFVAGRHTERSAEAEPLRTIAERINDLQLFMESALGVPRRRVKGPTIELAPKDRGLIARYMQRASDLGVTLEEELLVHLYEAPDMDTADAVLAKIARVLREVPPDERTRDRQQFLLSISGSKRHQIAALDVERAVTGHIEDLREICGKLVKAATGEQVDFADGEQWFDTLLDDERNRDVVIDVLNDTGTQATLFVKDRDQVHALQQAIPEEYDERDIVRVLQSEQGVEDFTTQYGTPVYVYRYSAQEIVQALDTLPQGFFMQCNVVNEAGQVSAIAVERRGDALAYRGEQPEGLPDAQEFASNPGRYVLPKTIAYLYAVPAASTAAAESAPGTSPTEQEGGISGEQHA